MDDLSGIWPYVLLGALGYFIAAGWGKLDKVNPRLSMALNVLLGLALVVSIVMVVMQMFRGAGTPL